MVGIDNDSNFESYEFEKTYDFSVEIPIVDEDTGEYTREIELVAGQITFFWRCRLGFNRERICL